MTSRSALVRALVVEMDHPDEAAAFLTQDLGEAWRTYVPLAAQPVERLREQACLELAEWYHEELTKGTNDFTRESMLRRAKTYYRRFAALHEAKDAAALKAKVAIDSIAAELAELEVPLRPAPEEKVAEKTAEPPPRSPDTPPPATPDTGHPYRRLIDRWNRSRWHR